MYDYFAASYIKDVYTVCVSCIFVLTPTEDAP